MHGAARHGRSEVVRMFLEAAEEGQAAARAPDAAGKTPRDLAEEQGHGDVVRILDDLVGEEDDDDGSPGLDALNCGVCYSKYSLKGKDELRHRSNLKFLTCLYSSQTPSGSRWWPARTGTPSARAA